MSWFEKISRGEKKPLSEKFIRTEIAEGDFRAEMMQHLGVAYERLIAFYKKAMQFEHDVTSANHSFTREQLESLESLAQSSTKIIEQQVAARQRPESLDPFEKMIIECYRESDTLHMYQEPELIQKLMGIVLDKLEPLRTERELSLRTQQDWDVMEGISTEVQKAVEAAIPSRDKALKMFSRGGSIGLKIFDTIGPKALKEAEKEALKMLDSRGPSL